MEIDRARQNRQKFSPPMVRDLALKITATVLESAPPAYSGRKNAGDEASRPIQ